MDILVSILYSAFLGSSSFTQLEVDLKSGSQLSYMFDVKSIKTDSPSLGLEIKNQPPNGNEDDQIDRVPPA